MTSNGGFSRADYFFAREQSREIRAVVWARRSPGL